MIAVLGYGSQGRAIALNLSDSGYPVIIGLKKGSASRRVARSDGFREIDSIADVVPRADWIVVALPDHLHGRIFQKDILPHLRPGATLIFLHGFSVHFGFVKPPVDCDVVLVAPHAPGMAVREKYLGERSLSAFYAVHQNHSRRARKSALAVAQAVGIEKSRLVKTTFEHEAVGDLFGEQAVLCGGLASLIQNGFEVLVEKGIPPENAYLEVAYQLDLIVDLIKKYGIEGMYRRISVAARYGSQVAGEKVVGKPVKKRMERLYREIASGRFAAKLNRLNDKEILSLSKRLHRQINPAFEKAGKKHRS